MSLANKLIGSHNTLSGQDFFDIPKTQVKQKYRQATWLMISGG